MAQDVLSAPGGSAGVASELKPIKSGRVDPVTRDVREQKLRETIKTDGLTTEARHMQYLDIAPTEGGGRVEVSAQTIEDMANILMRNNNMLTRLAARENTPQSSMASEIRKSLSKWENAQKFFRNEDGGKAPEGDMALTAEDLDVAYYTLFSEMMQLGVFMGREVSYRSAGGFMGMFRGRQEAYVHPQSPSYRRQSGLATDYMTSRYGQVVEPGQVEADLLALERTRQRFIGELTGHPVNDRVMNRVNWGTCTQSLFERGRSGLVLHNRILDQLEGNDSYQSILRRYSTQRGVQIRTISDLLVNIDNPRDLRDAMRLFHEAVGQASAERFGKAGADFVTAHITEKSQNWGEAGLVENAKRKMTQLEGEGRLTPEQRQVFEEMQAGLRRANEVFQGRVAEGANGAVPNLETRVNQLRDAARDYRDVLQDPENDVGAIRGVLTTARTRLAAYQAGGTPVPVPADIALYDTQINLVPGRRAAVPAPPAITPEEYARRMEDIEKDVNRIVTERNNLVTSHRQSAEREVQTLESRLTTARTARQNHTALQQSYQYFENGLPQAISDMRSVAEGIERQINPPLPLGGGARPPVADYILPHVARLTQQRDRLNAMITYLDTMRNGAGGINAVNRGPGQSWEDYVGAPPNPARFNYVLDLNQMRTYGVEMQEEIAAQDEILRGRVSPETRATIDGAQLVLAAATGLPPREAQAGTPPITARAEVHRLLDFANKRIYAETDWKNLMTSLTRDHDLTVVRTVLLDHPELQVDSRLRNPDLWRRVFSDQFILQSAVEYFREPNLPAVAQRANFFNIAANNPQRDVFIEKMAASRGRFGEFLTYLVEKKLTMIADSTQTPVDVSEAGIPGAPGGAIAQTDETRYGPGSRVFGADRAVDFWTRMDRDRTASEKTISGVWDLENIGHAAQRREVHITTPEGRVVRAYREIAVTANEQDPFVVVINGQRREIPYTAVLHRGPIESRFQLYLQANPSLVGLVPDMGGNYDRRWVDAVDPRFRVLGGRDFNNFDGFVNLVQAEVLPAGSAPVDVATFNEQFGNSISRTLGDWFLGRSAAVNRADFPRFPDIAINAALYPNLQAAYTQMSMDASGNIELQTAGANPRRVSLNSLLENEQNNDVVDQALRLIGRQVFDTMGV